MRPFVSDIYITMRLLVVYLNLSLMTKWMNDLDASALTYK